MQNITLRCSHLLLAGIATMSLVLASCGAEYTQHRDDRGQVRLPAGTWALKSRLIKGNWTPAVQRQLKLELSGEGTFTARYRGDANQGWIRAGSGALSYDPPHLTFFWDSGQIVRLIVMERKPEQIVIHHGRNLAPLKNQEPDELFVVRKTGSKSPDQPS